MKTRQWNWGSKQLLRGVFILFLVAGTLACSEDDVTSTTPETPENPNGDGDTDPSVPESENQKVVVYADQSTGEVLFAAPAQWTASVRTATRSGESTDWIDFEPKSGEAGENVILDLKLQLNTTGKDRSATIMVIADNDTTLLEGKHSVNHVFLSPTSIINFTSKKPSYDDTRRSGRDNELLQRAQNDL